MQRATNYMRNMFNQTLVKNISRSFYVLALHGHYYHEVGAL